MLNEKLYWTWDSWFFPILWNEFKISSPHQNIQLVQFNDKDCSKHVVLDFSHFFRYEFKHLLASLVSAAQWQKLYYTRNSQVSPSSLWWTQNHFTLPEFLVVATDRQKLHWTWNFFHFFVMNSNLFTLTEFLVNAVCFNHKNCTDLKIHDFSHFFVISTKCLHLARIFSQSSSMTKIILNTF